MDLSKDELMGEIYRHISSASDRVYRITGRCYKGGSTPRKRVAAWSEHISNHLDALIASPVDIEEEWAPGKGESVQYRDPDTGKIRYRPDMRVIERNGVDAGLKLVDLHSRAQSILNASTTGLRKLPLGMPGCPDCGEVLYTDGQKVLCRACARDWTEETAGMYERERQHVIEELRTQLAAVTAQRDAAWERCDQAQVLADAVYQPDFDQITVVQFGELLTGILKEHPTPEKRSQTTKNEPAPDPADS
jgi:predicted Fe-S protein YdhL (DUF1289 family)